jgi:L-lactate dehydrogenase complex protein LldF
MTPELRTFHRDAERVTADVPLRGFLRTALGGYEATRAGTQSRYRDYAGARAAAAAIKWEAIENLPALLESFADRIAARGAQVHWAANGDEARDIILGIAAARRAKRIVKSKCMTTEEIHLNDALEKAGYEVVESDLGEWIQQLRREAPFHFVFPSMHLRRGEIKTLFEDRAGTHPASDAPEELTLTARQALRRRFLEADIGISGANFALADTGQIAITENEGNARLTVSLPPCHIAVVGIEKVLPRAADLALFWPLLATCGTGQPMTCYNSLLGGPRQPGEIDGPEEMHVVLLDNHRTRLLADPEQRDALRCIRCGACLNVCPIFKNIGGLSYNTTYQGPIGSVITPHLRGLKPWAHLSHASSLCGACSETCPVKIDLHHHLLRNRRNAARAHPARGERRVHRWFARIMRRPAVYTWVFNMVRRLFPLQRWVAGTRFDPAAAWRRSRELPAPAALSFKEYWRKRGKS